VNTLRKSVPSGGGTKAVRALAESASAPVLPTAGAVQSRGGGGGKKAQESADTK
jgi:hypothetical protein